MVPHMATTLSAGENLPLDIIDSISVPHVQLLFRSG
jgi:hypothetical protein